MKGWIILFACLYWFNSGAQVTFYGDPEGVKGANTTFNEGFLTISTTGKLAIVRDKYPNNTGGQKDPGDIWFQKDSSFTNSLLPVNSASTFNSPIGFTADGNWFLYHESERIKGRWEGKVMAINLATSEKQELTIPELNNHSPTPSGCLSIDQNFLILSLERPNGYGVEDLYVCKKQEDGSWDSPQTLGYRLNTALQEVSPFLASDNKTLFFATNARQGFGGFDLYVTTRLDDTWRNWSEPLNLGAQVNSPGAETAIGFLPDAEYAFFISTQNSDGYGDVKRIKIKADIVTDTAKTTTPVVAVDTHKYFRIQLTNSKTGAVIQGKAIQSQISIVSNQNGELGLIDTLSGEVELKAEGYLSQVVTLPGAFVLEKIQTVSLEPLETGNVITLKQVLFYKSTANIVEGSERELDLVIEMMNDHQEITIFLKGHTDNVGDPRLNVQLSNERVLTVKDYLVEKGIDPVRIEGKGFGGSMPIGDNKTEETRQMNRRVEFEVKRN